MAKIILGFMGEMACGKGTATRYVVEKYKGKSYRFSTMLRDILDRLYLEQSRENMQRLSTILRQNFGEDLLSGVIVEDVKKEKSPVIVLDGIRRLTDIEKLKNFPEFKMVYIETDIKKCYERIIGRRENADDANKTFERFKNEHNNESELLIKELKSHADYVIDNNGSLEDLYKQLDKIINLN